MKFSLVLAPIMSMAVLAHGDKAAGPYSDSKPVSFTHEGVKNVLDVATNSPKADGEKTIQDVKAFFKRNPAVLKSILGVANDPKHKKAKDNITKQAIALYSKGANLDLYDIGLKAVDYIYENPDALDLIQQAGIKAMKDSPTLVDDFFASFEKLTEKDPLIVRKLKDHVIEFSDEQEDAYKKIFEMGLKSALINPGFASHLAVHALLVDKISCAGSRSGSCDCNDKYYLEEPTVPKEPDTEGPEAEVEEPEIKASEEPEIEEPEVEAEEPEIEASEEPKIEEPEVEVEEPETEASEEPEEPEINAPGVPKEPEVETSEVPEKPKVESPELPEEPEIKEPEVERPSYATEGPKITKETVGVPEAEVEEPIVIEEVDVPDQIAEPEFESEEPEIEEPRAPKESEIEESEAPEKPEIKESEVPKAPEIEDSKTPKKPQLEELETPPESETEEAEIEQPIVPENNIAPPQPKQPETDEPTVPETIVEPVPVPAPAPKNTYNVAPPAPKLKNTYTVAAPPLSKPVY